MVSNTGEECTVGVNLFSVGGYEAERELARAPFWAVCCRLWFYWLWCLCFEGKISSPRWSSHNFAWFLQTVGGDSVFCCVSCSWRKCERVFHISMWRRNYGRISGIRPIVYVLAGTELLLRVIILSIRQGMALASFPFAPRSCGQMYDVKYSSSGKTWGIHCGGGKS